MKINNNAYLMLYFMLLCYSGGMIFKTKNEKYIASNALAEINTLFALFLFTHFDSFNNTLLNALVIQAYCSVG
jgi:hypothetical protein